MKTLQGSFYHLQIYHKKIIFYRVSQKINGAARICTQVSLFQKLHTLTVSFDIHMKVGTKRETAFKNIPQI